MLKNITFLAVASAAVKPAWFIFITAVCMRLLGTEGYGVMSTALALCLLVMSVSDLGTAEYSVREVARSHARATSFFSNFLVVRFLASIVAFGCAVAVAVILRYDASALLAVGFAGIYVTALGLVAYCRAFFEAFQRLGTDAMSIAVEKVFVIGVGTALLVATRSAAWTLAGMALGMILTLALNVAWVSRRFAPFVRSTIDRAFIRRHLRSSIPFGVAGVLSIVYYRTDLVMIEAIRGAEEAGQYAVAFRILEALNLFPFVIVQAAMYPRLAALFHGHEREDFSTLMRRGTAALLVPSLAVAAALTVWGPALIAVLDSDPAYRPAGLALQVLCWTFPLTCLNALLYIALLAVNEQRFRAQALAVTVVLNVGLNAILIPKFGIIGAAVATIASEVFVVAAYAWRYHSALGSSWRGPGTNAPIESRPGPGLERTPAK
jgi:O-antigen/teichoic acid export membrane protein